MSKIATSVAPATLYLCTPTRAFAGVRGAICKLTDRSRIAFNYEFPFEAESRRPKKGAFGDVQESGGILT